MSLRVESISYRVARTELLAPMSASFAAGRLTAILGPNGAGKSTLLSLLSGQSKPASGCVYINGHSLNQFAAAHLARFRAVMSQDHSVAFEYCVQDIVELGRYPHRMSPSPNEASILKHALAAADMQALSHRVFSTLSGGEKARTQFARVMAQIWEPIDGISHRWLLLDEPTAALDVAHQHTMLSMLRRWVPEQGVGLVAVLHDLNLALRYADDVLLLDQGRCVANGKAGEVLKPALIADVWGLTCEITQASDGVPQLLFNAPASLPALEQDRITSTESPTN